LLSKLTQGLFCPLCPYFSFYVSVFPAIPIICAPRQIPSVGILFSINFLVVSIVAGQF
jgi:hypothetical protein